MQLRERVASREAEGERRSGKVDVLITAVAESLWIAEHFAADLQMLFPTLAVVPISSNKVIGVLSNARGAAAMSGFSFSAVTNNITNGTIVLSVSHSGQTFPTLHATHALRKLCGDRVFVMSGAIDSKLAGAIKQPVFPTSEWGCRVLNTHAGWRPAESITLSTVATHQTFTELLLFFASTDPVFLQKARCPFSSSDAQDMRKLSTACLKGAIPSIVGHDADGSPNGAAVAERLRKQGRRWGWHVAESPVCWGLSAAYILLTVNSGATPVRALVGLAFGEDAEAAIRAAVAADSIIYVFLPLWFALALRVLTGRPLLARLGKRTVVLANVPYVHQLLESFLSKLFALSYSASGISGASFS